MQLHSTPGNVIRGNQKLCKGNLYGCNRPWLTALEKVKCSYSRNILARFQLDFGKSGNNFHFCTKEKKIEIGNASSRFLI